MSDISGYTLVICEKPDAAPRVAEALSDGSSQSSTIDGVRIFRFKNQGEDFVVCSAQGHVYAISDPFQERAVYPVFDVEWYPTNLIEKNTNAARRIKVIRELAKNAGKFVNACDFDPEGETIGFNILRYACGARETEVLRAKFSTLTRGDIVEAFRHTKTLTEQGPARAGRARHLVDFMWGVNLSRALSQSALNSGHRYQTISIGRVQGPTLAFLAEKEKEIRQFAPSRFWSVSGTFEKEGIRLTARYSEERVKSRAAAEKVRDDCKKREALATSVAKSEVQVSSPPPFSTGDLQKEAYKAFGFSPSQTLQVAEKLYLSALISYPRTSSQRLPPSIDYRVILQRLERLSDYSKAAGSLLGSVLNPTQGNRADLAHPAIHPTGEAPHGRMNKPEAGVFDLIVRRFLASFGPPARRELFTVKIAVGRHGFVLSGGRTLSRGWLESYGRYADIRDTNLPNVAEGDRLQVVDVEIDEKLERGPQRYNQSSLLEKMERENIGTKATRADVITTLVERGYVEGTSMKVTELGTAVVETVEKYAPEILTTKLTREIENKIESVESDASKDSDLIRETIRSIAEQLEGLRLNEDLVGRDIDAAAVATTGESLVLGLCPVCKSGQLRVIRSRKTKKRFVGCTRYASGCLASAPLPQRGTIKTAFEACIHCSWPVVRVMHLRRTWRLCVNPACPAKSKKGA